LESLAPVTGWDAEDGFITETNTRKRFFNRRDILRTVIIVLILYPLINLFRGIPYVFMSFSIHLREISFFLLALFLLFKLLVFVHRRAARISRLRESVASLVIVEVVLLLLYTPLVSFPLFLLHFADVFYQQVNDPRGAILFTIFMLFILLIYLYHLHLQDHFDRLKEAINSREKMKIEKIVAYYKALQNHVSPHFVFNCLGGLNGMIRKDPVRATEIVHHLSDCLRHILSTLDQATIPLDDEMRFIRKYRQLLDMSCSGAIVIREWVGPALMKKEVPPCLIQMLIENAVKHNRMSAGEPLFIVIRGIGANRLEVSNNIQPKEFSAGTSITGTGLTNIRERYALLTPDPVVIRREENRFYVEIPLI